MKPMYFRGSFQKATPSANNAELVGQLEHAITDREYPPTVWAARTTSHAIQLRTRAHLQRRPVRL